MRLPSVKTLVKAFPHPLKDSPTLACIIRDAMRSRKTDDAMSIINDILEGHGVEAIRFEDESNCFRCGTLSTFINMGDTYDPTIVWDAKRQRFIVTSWGDFVEYEDRHGRSCI